jgi:hypothetical protein
MAVAMTSFWSEYPEYSLITSSDGVHFATELFMASFGTLEVSSCGSKETTGRFLLVVSVMVKFKLFGGLYPKDRGEFRIEFLIYGLLVVVIHPKGIR